MPIKTKSAAQGFDQIKSSSNDAQALLTGGIQSAGAKTGMSGIGKKGGEFGASPNSSRPQNVILSKNTNGMGLWVHQSASQAKLGNNSDNLPPIKGTPSTNSNKPPRKAGMASLDFQSDKGLIAVLEKKYQEAVQECDKANI